MFTFFNVYSFFDKSNQGGTQDSTMILIRIEIWTTIYDSNQEFRLVAVFFINTRCLK